MISTRGRVHCRQRQHSSTHHNIPQHTDIPPAPPLLLPHRGGPAIVLTSAMMDGLQGDLLDLFTKAFTRVAGPSPLDFAKDVTTKFLTDRWVRGCIGQRAWIGGLVSLAQPYAAPLVVVRWQHLCMVQHG
jgi:hypothetical protein